MRQTVSSSESVIAGLTDIFRDLFDDDAITLTRETNADDIEDWDSLQQINIVLAAQQKFGLKLNARKTLDFDHVGQLADYIVSEWQRQNA